MVCYVLNYTVIAGLIIDGCFDILIFDEQWDFRRFFFFFFSFVVGCCY